MADAVTLDVKDRKILSELDMGARQPLSAIAKKVGLSREVVNYRISQLERKNVILGYFTDFDTARLGLIYCRMLFKYRKISMEKEKELMDFCTGNEHIAWIILGEGRWDIVLVVLADSLGKIEKVYDELNALFGHYFQNPYISIAFKVRSFKHKYLYPVPDYREVVLGAASESASLDAMDHSIISTLSKSAKMPLVEIAAKLGISQKAVSRRMKRLESEGVILAFRALINTKLLGYDYYKVFLSIQNLDKATLFRLEEFLRRLPSVIHITKPMGTYNFEFEAMVTNTNELHNLLRKLKAEFSDAITDYEIFFNYEVLPVGHFLGSAHKQGREDSPAATS